MEKLKNLEDLFLHELKDLYSAETQIIDALPKMAEKAEDPQLKNSLQMRSVASCRFFMGEAFQNEKARQCRALKQVEGLRSSSGGEGALPLQALRPVFERG